MNSLVAAVRCSIAWLVLFQVSAAGPARAEVTTYPAPPGEAISGDYTVTVNGKPVDVYAAQSQYFEGDYYFGRPVTQDSPCVQIGPHVADVTFRK